MAIREIIRVDEPNDKSYRGGLFRLWYKGPEGTEYPRDVHQLKHDRLMFEQMLLVSPITVADMETYKELLRAEIQDDEAFEGACM